MEEVHWRQLSRELWLREGDRNTGFFHRMANARRRANTLADIEGLVLKQISLSEAEALEFPFSEAEIYAALMRMNGDKAPGPDGFTVAFWQKCWEIVKEDVLDMFKEFHEQNSFIRSLNHTFLVLLPKKGGAEDLGDYRPISLLGGLYKLLAKVLANRLKKVICKVISTDQNAFIKGRQILDGSLITNEVMQKMGFGSKWIGWMWSCISTVKYSMLVNGVPAGFFSSSKGLRQGDPPSPYLFVMGMEVLSALITRAVEGGFHLWLVLVVFELDSFWFEAASAAHCFIWGCPSGRLIGLPPFGMGWRRKMRRRLALWKRQFLSKGGRISLIKSTLASIPLYQMSLFRMPKSVARRLEKLQRNFCGGSQWGNKAYLIKWEVANGFGGLRVLRRSFGKKVLEAKYGQEEFGWRTRKANGVFGVGVWKEILKESAWCWENMVFKVGKGNKIRFGLTLGVETMCCPKASRASFPWLPKGTSQWRIMRSESGVTVEEDSVLWREGADGLFKVKKAYRVLANAEGADFPHSNVWVDKVPTKIAFFAWEATWGKVLTLDRLQRRGWQFPNLCFLCGCEEETINHILIHCTVAKRIVGYHSCVVWCTVGISKFCKEGS
ncbi:LINE-1 reverse transcriptase-like [Vitis vinifera]|uniref:LINE-1 reverse transcriptase-like n=1 Tax=Vitis vinifera TaxID=29760 RepID=A0A438F1F1_VITVI|nr:LINE-1 reverse transcriptase-like [Vitis vinifera]